jgi:hypothetical protein
MDSLLSAPPTVDELKRAPERVLDMTITEMHSIPQPAIEEIQLEGLQQHFRSLVDRVPVLSRFAEDQQVKDIQGIEDAAPLLLPHSVYKSYPVSVLERGGYDQLTKWLDTLTVYDLSGLDASACQGIDDWIDLLDAKTELRVKHSSGTTGKLSFVPRSLPESAFAAKGFVKVFEGFGDEPGAKIEGFAALPIISAGYRRGAMGQARLMDAVTRFLHNGDESLVIASNPGRLSADVLSIGGRLQAAEARGELGKAQMQIPPALRARRDAFIKEQAEQPERLRAFFADVTKRLRGQRVVVLGVVWQMFEIAAEGVKNGVTGVFSSDSLMQVAGGMKGRVLPPDYREIMVKFFGLKAFPRESYGMSEMVTATHRSCPLGFYHFRPHCIPYLLDPKTGEPQPRTGTQTGRFGFVDLLAKTHWGGFLSGDEVTMNFGDKPCACGRTGAYAHPGIRRYSEKEGGDDKITCAGAPDAHDKALAFIAGALG